MNNPSGSAQLNGHVNFTYLTSVVYNYQWSTNSVFQTYNSSTPQSFVFTGQNGILPFYQLQNLQPGIYFFRVVVTDYTTGNTYYSGTYWGDSRLFVIGGSISVTIVTLPAVRSSQSLMRPSSALWYA